MNYGTYMPMQPFGYQPQFNSDLERRNKELGEVKERYNAVPVNNIINTAQNPNTSNFVELRVLNENENVDTLYVQNKTLFINDNNMILKGIDGSLEKWEIQKIYPVDPKDKKIRELELQIKELKEMINREPSSTSVEYAAEAVSEQ